MSDQHSFPCLPDGSCHNDGLIEDLRAEIKRLMDLQAKTRKALDLLANTYESATNPDMHHHNCKCWARNGAVHHDCTCGADAALREFYQIMHELPPTEEYQP